MAPARAPLPELCSKRQAAEVLGISIPTVDGMINTGQLPTILIHKRLRIPRWALTKIIASPASAEVAGDEPH